MTFWDMTIYNDTLNCSGITPICELITELDFITDFDFIAKFWRFPWNIATGKVLSAILQQCIGRFCHVGHGFLKFSLISYNSDGKDRDKDV